jgi:murein DD-endopeptidase MepM/ murein hydrolase activator NlpD
VLRTLTATALFVALTSVASAATIHVERPASVGGVLELRFSFPGWVDAAEVELRRGDASSDGPIVARTWAFNRADWDRWVGLIGVPSWSDPGEYTVVAHLYQIAESDPGIGRIVRRTTTVEIHPREFRRERIALNRAMSTLRRDDSEERRRESVELAELLRTTNPASIYTLRNFVRPVQSERRTSWFGDRRTFEYSDGAVAGSIHHGVDFGVPTGTPVSAPAAGRVVLARSRIITGNTVVIEHLPGVYTLYYHLDRIDVAEGEMVRSGVLIGTVGSTGLSTGPHLHWELRVAGVPVDPEPFLARPILDFRPDSGKIGAWQE